MSLPVFRYPRGAPIAFDHVVVGVTALDPASVTVIQKLKPCAGQVVPPKGTAAVATFSASFVAATGGEAAYWRMSLAPTVSANLAAGWYASDAEFIVASSVVAVSEPVLILIGESVTPV